jgi:N-acetylglucosamine transport system permease protein
MPMSSKPMRRGERLFVVSFLAPAVLIYGLFVLWPLVQAFMFSAYRWRGVSAHRTFVGWENFQKLAADGVFFRAVRNNLTLLVFAGLAILVIGVALAHGLQGQSRTSRTLRAVVLFPQMTSLVVVAILWTFLMNPQFGVFSGIDKGHAWLGDPKTALPGVGVAFVWYAIGFYIMLFAAALRSLPGEVVEAAELDGAVGLRRFWQVTWPMLWSIKRIAVVHLTISVMNVFALVFLMTQGGPDRATEVMLTYLYESAFKNSQFGYATAIAVANFGVVMVLAVLILAAFRKDPQEAR